MSDTANMHIEPELSTAELDQVSGGLPISNPLPDPSPFAQGEYGAPTPFSAWGRLLRLYGYA